MFLRFFILSVFFVSALGAQELDEAPKLTWQQKLEKAFIKRFLYKDVELDESPGKSPHWIHKQYKFENGEKYNLWWWLGNVDDPIAPDWFLPDSAEWVRKLRWHLRNPLHNFTFYVIGVADKVDEDEYSRVGLYPRSVIAPEEGWNWSATQIDSWVLPFLSYWQDDFLGSNRRLIFYFGWRERGNFGAKINLKKTKAP